MTKRKTIYRRVGVFQSLEVHVQTEDQEWFRDDNESTPSVAAQINEFAEDRGVEVVFISPPTIELVGKGPAKRLYRTAVSIIYIPSELIGNDESIEETGQQITRNIALPETPEEIYKILGHSLTEQLTGFKRGE